MRDRCFSHRSLPVFILALLTLTGTGAATQVSLRARPESQFVDVGESLQIEVVVEIEDGPLPSNYPTIVPPDPLAVVVGSPRGGMPRSRPGSSRPDNGPGSWEIPYIYPVRFKRPGEYVFQAVYLDYQGTRAHASETFQVTVGYPGAVSPEPVAGEPVQVFARLSRDKAYRGEMVVLSIVAYSRHPIAKPPELVRFGRFEGFFAEPVTGESSQNLKIVDGEKFYVQTAALRYALFPVTAGTLGIPELEIRLAVTVPVKTELGAQPKTQYLYRETPAVSLEVVELPELGRPPGFQGLVGNLSMKAELGADTVVQGDGLTLKVIVEGEADFSKRWEPEIPEPRGFRVHEPSVRRALAFSEDRVQGSKTWSYPLVSVATGTWTIGPVMLTVFNPILERYEMLKSATERVVVLAPEASFEDSIYIQRGPRVATKIDLKSEDFRYIHEQVGPLRRPQGYLATNPFYLIGHIVPFLLLVAASFYRRRRLRLGQDTQYARRAAAPRVARRALEDAKRVRTGSAGTSDLYSSLTQVITELLASWLDIPARGLRRADLRDSMVHRGLPEDLASQVVDFLARMEEKGFSGDSASRTTAEADIREAESLVSSILDT